MKLAINGGKPIRKKSMPKRNLVDYQERNAVLKYFDNVIKNEKELWYGRLHQKIYEDDFVNMMGGGYGIAVNSGTKGLYIALQSLYLDVNSEIIVPAITDPGGIMPVTLLGLIPIAADTDPRTYNICINEIKKKTSKNTKAIIVAHIGGDVIDLDPVINFTKINKLHLIEDCSQAHGAKYNNV